MKYYHTCIGCLSKIEITKKYWDFCKQKEATVCDYCFFDVGDILKFKGKTKWNLLRQYQVKATMLRENAVLRRGNTNE